MLTTCGNVVDTEFNYGRYTLENISTVSFDGIDLQNDGLSNF